MALSVLESARGRDPANRDLLVALIQYNAKVGKHDAAACWLEELAAAAPDDPALEQLRALVDQSRQVTAPADDG